MVSTKKLNRFPSKGQVSKYLILHAIMSVRNVNFNKHCQIPFGAYVQVANISNPTNKNAPRTLHQIYLQPLDKKQVGH